MLAKILLLPLAVVCGLIGVSRMPPQGAPGLRQAPSNPFAQLTLKDDHPNVPVEVPVGQTGGRDFVVYLAFDLAAAKGALIHWRLFAGKGLDVRPTANEGGITPLVQRAASGYSGTAIVAKGSTRYSFPPDQIDPELHGNEWDAALGFTWTRGAPSRDNGAFLSVALPQIPGQTSYENYLLGCLGSGAVPVTGMCIPAKLNVAFVWTDLLSPGVDPPVPSRLNYAIESGAPTSFASKWVWLGQTGNPPLAVVSSARNLKYDAQARLIEIGLLLGLAGNAVVAWLVLVFGGSRSRTSCHEDQQQRPGPEAPPVAQDAQAATDEPLESKAARAGIESGPEPQHGIPHAEPDAPERSPTQVLAASPEPPPSPEDPEAGSS